jgi:hypothetical protein
MKFKLLEYSEAKYRPTTKNITTKQAAQLLNTTYSSATKVTPIFRGIHGVSFDSPVIITPDHNNPRMSRNTSNQYTLVINNHPKWQKFPKRQIICSTSIDRVMGGYAAEESEAYQVFPINGAKIGIVKYEDIWDADFADGITFMDDVFSLLENVLIIGGEKQTANSIDLIGDNNPKIYEDLLYQCRTIDNYKDHLKKAPPEMMDMPKTLQEYLNSNKPFLEFMVKEWWNPKGFTVSPIESFYTTGNHEVWTDAPCLFIPAFPDTSLLNKYRAL